MGLELTQGAVGIPELSIVRARESFEHNGLGDPPTGHPGRLARTDATRSRAQLGAEDRHERVSRVAPKHALGRPDCASLGEPMPHNAPSVHHQSTLRQHDVGRRVTGPHQAQRLDASARRGPRLHRICWREATRPASATLAGTCRLPSVARTLSRCGPWGSSGQVFAGALVDCFQDLVCLWSPR